MSTFMAASARLAGRGFARICSRTASSAFSSFFALTAKLYSWAGVTGEPNSFFAFAGQTTQTLFA